jgi:hypothetical protein
VIARLELRHLRTYLDHDPSDLVPAQDRHREHADVLSGDRQIGMAKAGGPDINEYFSPQRMCQLYFSHRETGANGVDDCGFHPSSSSISPGRGRMVATIRQYMKVNFEGKLHILVAASALFGRR